MNEKVHLYIDYTCFLCYNQCIKQTKKFKKQIKEVVNEAL